MLSKLICFEVIPPFPMLVRLRGKVEIKKKKFGFFPHLRQFECQVILKLNGKIN